MRDFPKLTFFVILVSVIYCQTPSNCGKGCLICQPSGYCSQCDTLLFFINVNGTCVLNPRQGCNSTNINGNCQLCSNSYFLFNSSCFPTIVNITNCIVYISASTCGTCSNGYFLTGGICKQLTAIISNCLTYSSSGVTCLVCQKGYVTSFDALSCVKSTPVANCQSYSNLKCQQCQGGYLNTGSGYHGNIGLLATSQTSILQQQFLNYLTIVRNNLTASYIPTCLFIKVQNCLTAAYYNKCSVCNPGYFLNTDLQCQRYPTTAIGFCAIYASNVTCSLCQTLYYLDIAGACQPVTPIVNCVNYSSIANNICQNCASGFYSTLTACLPRVESLNITNCVIVDPYNDRCLTCSSIYTVSFDGTICINSIPNCGVYTKTAVSVTCSACVQNYYLSNGQCLLSAATNCQNVTGLTNCGLCNQGYYLLNQVCVSHTLTNLLSCNTTSTLVLNQCTKCDSTKVLAFTDGLCVSVVNALSNCISYLNPTTCSICNPAVSYNLNGVCYSVYLPNCLIYNANLVSSCSQCRLDLTNNIIYIAFPVNAQNNNCLMGNPNIANNCNSITNAGNVEGCTSCMTNYYPLIMQSLNNAYCVPRSYYLLSGQAMNIINCVLYDHITKVCMNCVSGMVVDTSGLCVFQCSSGSFLYSYIFTTTPSTDVSLIGLNVCKAITPNNNAISFTAAPFACYFLAESAVTAGTFYCAGCTAFQIGVIDLTISQAFPVLTSLWPIAGLVSFSFDNRIASIQQCVSRQSILTGSTSSVGTLVVRAQPGVPFSFNNCRYAVKVGNLYGCGACNFGFTGAPIADFDNTGYFIFTCVQVQNCLPNVYYKGIGSLSGQVSSTSPPIDFFLTCHICSGGQIPTLARSSAAITTGLSPLPNIQAGFIAPFSYPSATDTELPYQKITNLGTVTSCQPIGFGQIFVTNCGVQELWIDKLIAPFAVSLGVNNNPLCRACLPGFAPTFISGTTVIATCPAIPFCNINLSLKFNKCDSCSSNYALAYDIAAPDGLSFYTSCVYLNNNDINCMYGYASTNTCAVCTSGYFLNNDGFCDSSQLFDCQINGFLSPLTLAAYKSISLFGTGCQQCSDNSILIRFGVPIEICVLSSLLKSNVNISASKFLIPNCKNFSFDVNKNVICNACATNYFLTLSGVSCIVNNLAITNCLVYMNNGQGCSVCVNLYYSNAQGICVLGTNLNCLVYSTTSFNSCSTCLVGFVVIMITTTYSVCIPDPAVNCAQWKTNIATPGLISCAVCQSNFFYQTSQSVLGSNPLPICVGIPKIVNCVNYDNTNGIVGSSLGCIACSSGFYVSNRVCIARANVSIPNCQTLNPIADSCLTCVSGFWIDINFVCNPFPVGISGCIQYKNLQTCQLCDKNMYLNQNKCIAVPSEQIIPNCMYYDANFNCLNCSTNFFAETLGSCVAVLATNCLTYLSTTHCGSCPQNYGFIKTNLLTYCALISIPNCLIPDYASFGPNFACKICQTSFYLNSQLGCTAVAVNIPQCYLYSSSVTCLYCFTGYILTPLATACIINPALQINVDPNCLYSKISTEPFCNTCKSNYYLFDDGLGSTSCKPCEGNNPYCLTCDPSDPSVCFACISGYTQMADGNCTKTFQQLKSLSSEKIIRKVLILCLVFLFLRPTN